VLTSPGAGSLCKFVLRVARALIGVLVFPLIAQAQAPLPLPNLPLLSNGSVSAIARQSDGGLLLGGSFISINGVARSNIARLLPDGTLDPNWNPSADSPVSALAVDSSGAVYVGGSFSNIGGLPRRGIAKLSGGTGAADVTWNASSNDSIYALALGRDGSIYVGGGEFSNLGSVAKLSAGTGYSDSSWHRVYGFEYVFALAVDPSGAVYAGGSYGSYTGPTVAKLDGNTGQVDPSWVAPDLGNTNHYVTALATDSSGAVYVGGLFGLRKFSGSTGAADAAWVPSSDRVLALTIDQSGAVFAGGFSNVANQPHGFIAKLSGTTGTALPKWSAAADSGVSALALDPSGTVYAGGSFSSISGRDRIGFATLSATGNPIGSANDVESPGAVDALAAQPAGGMIVGGHFLKVGQVSRRHILRVNADGTLDAKWDPAADGPVAVLAVDANDSVYAAGCFATIGGQAHNGLAKLSGSGKGAVDATWNSSADGIIVALAADTSGAVYVGGDFFNIGGEPRRAIAKLSGATGVTDAGWNATADVGSFVDALALASDGSLYVGGDFGYIGGQPRQNIAKLFSSTGLADPNWDPSSNGAVFSLAVDASGAVYASGQFGSIGGQSRLLIAKLAGSGNGAAESGWNAGLGYDGFNPGLVYVAPLTVDAKGTVYAGGFFIIGHDWSESVFAKLSGTNGSIDRAWNPFAGVSGYMPLYALATAADGSIQLGGYFTMAGGEQRYGLAAFGATLTDPIFANGFEQAP